MSEQNKKKEDLIKLASLGGGDKDLLLLDRIHEAMDYVVDLEEKLKSINPNMSELLEQVRGKDGIDGIDGLDYVLTNEDRKAIAEAIEVPVVEKVIEKQTKVIEKQPIVKTKVVEKTPKVVNKITKEVIQKVDLPKNLVTTDNLEQIIGDMPKIPLSKDATLEFKRLFPTFPNPEAGGSGATFLKSMRDVNLKGLADMNVLRYDIATKKWIPSTSTNGISIGDPITGGTANRLLYEDSDNKLAESDNLTFDGTDLSVTGDISGNSVLYNTSPTSVLDQEGATSWNSTYKTLNVNSGFGYVNQVGQELATIIKNTTGVSVPSGRVIRLTGVDGGYPTFELAKADEAPNIRGEILVTTSEMADGEIGAGVTFGRIQDVNTAGLFGPIYISPDTAGEFTTTKPSFPDYPYPIGAVEVADAVNGVIAVDVNAGAVTDTFQNFWNGTFRESFDFRITSNGTVITGSLEPSNGHDNMTMLFSDGFTILDTNPAVTVTLTAGTDTNPQTNYVYIPVDTKVITTSTSGFPTTEHIKVAICYLQTATTTQTNGALRNQNINNEIQDTTSNIGHLQHMGDRIRAFNSEWDSGAEATLSGTPTNMYISNTSGKVYQMHLQTFPAQDMSTGDDIHIVNDPTTPFTISSDLAQDITVDATGGTLTNRWLSFVVWGVANKTGEESHLMCNLPTGSYTSEADAVEDALGYSVYDIPREFRGVGFLMGRFTVRKGATATAWTYNNTVGYQDLRGFIPNSTAGSGAGSSGITTFTGLTDTPSSYTGNANYLATVNAGETALEFVHDISDYVPYTGATTDIDIGSNDFVTTGNVGIGTTDPDEKLDVKGNALFGTNSSSLTSTPLNVSFGGTYGSNTAGTAGNLKWDMFNSGAGNRYGIGMSNSLMEFQAGSNGSHAFFVDQGTEVMRIKSDGNVGIGTTNPGHKLAVYDNTQTQILASGYAAGLADPNNGQIELGAAGNYQGVIKYVASGGAGDLYIENTWDSVGGDIVFRTRTAGTPVEGMRIDGDGNVGIGTDSPSKKFVIEGTTNRQIAFDVYGSTDPTMFLSDSSGNLDRVLQRQATTNDLYIGDVDNNGGDLYLRSAGSTGITLLSSGNVGIGTTDPETKTHISDGVVLDSTLSSGLGAWNFLVSRSGATNAIGTMTASNSASARGINTFVRSRGTLSTPLIVQNNDQLGDLLFGGYTGTTVAYSAGVFAYVDGTPSSTEVPARISFVTGSNSSNRQERLKIGSGGDIDFNSGQLFIEKSTGNTGIGTNQPSVLSHIQGSAVTNKNIMADSTFVVEDEEGLLQFIANDSYSYAGGLVFTSAPSSGANKNWGLIAGGPSVSNNFSIRYSDVDTTSLGDMFNSKEIMTFTKDGNVGIGTTSPDATFDVAGEINYEIATSTPSALGNLGATETIDWSSATHFTGTLDSDVTITHSNETSGQKITLVLSYSGAQRTITWSDVDEWSGGSAPTAPSSGETLIVTLLYVGTTCYGSGELFS